MRYFVGGCIAVLMAIVQVSAVQQFELFGIAPNLVLVLLVSWVVVRGLDDVLPMVAVCGLVLALIDLQTPGLVMLGLVIPVFAAGIVRELHFLHGEIVLSAGLVLGASVLYEGLMFAYVMATGGPIDPVVGLTHTVLPAAIVNLAIAVPVYLLMRLARPSAQRNAYSW